jgi:hypothetical protein
MIFALVSEGKCLFHLYTNVFSLDTSFEALMVVNLGVEFSWVVMSCSVVVGYHHFRDEDRGSMDLRNVGILSQHYMVSQPRT